MTEIISIEQLLREGEAVNIVANGRSMRPTFRSGKDHVEITPCGPDDINVGDVVFFDRGDQYCLHRVISRSGDHLVIRGDGNRHNALEKVSVGAVLGRVTAGTMYGGKTEFHQQDKLWRRNTALVLRYHPIIAACHRIADIILSYPLSIVATLVLLYLSFFKPTRPLFEDLQNADKLTHLVMYFGLSLVYWLEWMLAHVSHNAGRMRGIMLCTVLPTLLSGVVELMQEYLTTYRTGEWMDFIANAAGALLATAFSLAVTRRIIIFVKHKK